LSFKNVFDNFFVPEKLSELVESNEKERSNCSIKRGDIFLTRTSETVKELGMSCVALTDFPNATFNGFTKRLRPNNNYQIVPEYVGYYLRSSKFRKEVTAMSSASTRASLNNEMIGRLKIVLPSQEEQKRIADVLSCLDAKIENLKRQNETLEKIAQTLFKHWFIDFEFPNADDKPYKSSGEVMVPSELGDIPKSWRVGNLGDIYKTTSGGTPSRTEPQYYFQGTIPWIKSKELYSTIVLDTEEKITDLGFKNSSAKLLPKNSILVAMYGATVGQVSILGVEATCNQAICAILEQEYSNFFAYLFLNLKKKEWSGMAIGSAQQNLSQVLILKIKLIIPSIELVKYFHGLVSPIFQKILLNETQIQTLTKIRHSLLPKLMSGQIRVEE
jgi:type I restriction enzyme S subunit